jgi:hypothetical protein
LRRCIARQAIRLPPLSFYCHLTHQAARFTAAAGGHATTGFAAAQQRFPWHYGFRPSGWKVTVILFAIS